jgi:hypothetical protein
MFEFLGVESATEPSQRWVSRKVPRLSCPQTYGPSGYRGMVAAMAKVPEDSETTRTLSRGLQRRTHLRQELTRFLCCSGCSA